MLQLFQVEGVFSCHVSISDSVKALELVAVIVVAVANVVDVVVTDVVNTFYVLAKWRLSLK